MGKTLVLGLGNPILTDDGVGVKAAMAVAGQLSGAGSCEEHAGGDITTSPLLSFGESVDVMEASVGGMRLMEAMVGYDRVILVDAIQTVKGTPGEIYRLGLQDIESALPTRHSSSSHDVNLPTALAMGRRLQLHLPEEIVIFAVEAVDVVTFGENCTPHVEAAVSRVAGMVLEELKSPQREEF